ncbi:MAG: energy transducer TonB [Cytophagaceae bacterium]|nr:energy transducer TonB [Cytophagaceae bacterium]
MKLILTWLLMIGSIVAFGQPPSDSLSKDERFSKYLAQNVRFPQEAMRQGILAKVYGGFRIDEQGNVQDVVILNPEKIGYGFEEVVTRVLRKMPVQRPVYAGTYAAVFDFGFSSGPNNSNTKLIAGKLPSEFLGQREIVSEVVIIGVEGFR